jgi:hypothetical protein
VLDECLSCLPPNLRQSDYVRRMLYLARTGAIDARGMSDAGITSGATATDPSYQWRWTVVTGDNPSLIAKKITGDDRRYVELIAANPSKPTKGDPSSPYSTGYNFASLTTGEKLYVPKAWNVYIASDGSGYTGGTPLPAGPAPTTPTSTTTTSPGMYTATLPTGTITAIKLQLGGWGKKEGTLTTYPGLFDTNDVIDEAFLGAVRKFQTWSNDKRGTALRTDGQLDADTHAALNAYTSGSVPTTMPGTTPGTTTPPATTPPSGLPPLFTPPASTTTPGGGPVAVETKTKKVGGSAGPLIAILALGAAKVANII